MLGCMVHHSCKVQISHAKTMEERKQIFQASSTCLLVKKCLSDINEIQHKLLHSYLRNLASNKICHTYLCVVNFSLFLVTLLQFPLCIKLTLKTLNLNYILRKKIKIQKS